jgi:SAM-dependent methyltransferase
MRDFTKDYDYARLIEEEKVHFAEIEVTEELTEGGIHASSAWSFYWQHVWKILGNSGFGNLPAYVCGNFPADDRPIEVLSLASGYCGNELSLARGMTRPYKITCTDLNEAAFEKAKSIAKAESLAMEFQPADLNFLTITPGRYDLIFAHAAIHHVINLEHLFEQIANGLSPTGILRIVEVVGKNRKLIWDRNERYANALLGLMPEELTHGIHLAVHEDPDGMEGIRQEDIFPLLRKHFVALFEHCHGAFMRFICTHPELGAAFNVNDPEARRCLEFLIASDDCAVRYGILAPLEIWGVYRPSSISGLRADQGRSTATSMRHIGGAEIPETAVDDILAYERSVARASRVAKASQIAEHTRHELEGQIATLEARLAESNRTLNDLRRSRLLKIGRVLRRLTGQTIPY